MAHSFNKTDTPIMAIGNDFLVEDIIFGSLDNLSLVA